MKINKKLKRVYLACPYSHKDKAVMLERVRRATMAAAYIMAVFDRVVFSPITHSHYIAEFLDNHLSHEFWLSQDASHVDSADELWVLKLDGWEKSFGVTWEIGYATGQGKDITYVTWEEVEEWYRERYITYLERMDGHA